MAKVKSKYQGKDGIYYIVNPAGAVHDCDREHAEMRLKTLGFRLAEDAEIEMFRETKTQRFQTPIAEPWSPEPVIEAWMPDEEVKPVGPTATPAAIEKAKKLKVDLSKITGTGTDGQILVADVEKASG